MVRVPPALSSAVFASKAYPGFRRQGVGGDGECPAHQTKKASAVAGKLSLCSRPSWSQGPGRVFLFGNSVEPLCHGSDLIAPPGYLHFDLQAAIFLAGFFATFFATFFAAAIAFIPPFHLLNLCLMQMRVNLFLVLRKDIPRIFFPRRRRVRPDAGREAVRRRRPHRRRGCGESAPRHGGRRVFR